MAKILPDFKTKKEFKDAFKRGMQIQVGNSNKPDRVDLGLIAPDACKIFDGTTNEQGHCIQIPTHKETVESLNGWSAHVNVKDGRITKILD